MLSTKQSFIRFQDPEYMRTFVLPFLRLWPNTSRNAKHVIVCKVETRKKKKGQGSFWCSGYGSWGQGHALDHDAVQHNTLSGFLPLPWRPLNKCWFLPPDSPLLNMSFWAVTVYMYGQNQVGWEDFHYLTIFDHNAVTYTGGLVKPWIPNLAGKISVELTISFLYWQVEESSLWWGTER